MRKRVRQPDVVADRPAQPTVPGTPSPAAQDTAASDPTSGGDLRSSGEDSLAGQEWDAAELAAAEVITRTVSQLVPGLAAALGPDTEVVLHDLTKSPHSIVAIAGGITGREVGGPLSDLALRVLRTGWTRDLIGYSTELADGTVLRSSTVFLRTETGRPVCSLCINSDQTALVRAKDALAALTAVQPLPLLTGPSSSSSAAEQFPRTIDDLAAGILREAVGQPGIPVALMQKVHKVAVVRELNDRGFFILRESVDLAARALSITRFSVYNYLNEIEATPSAEEAAPPSFR